MNRQQEIMDFSGGAVARNPPANEGDAEDSGSIPESGRSPGAGNGTPLQYSCLENPMDRGAWWAAVHGVAKSRTRLHFHFHFSLSCIGEGSGNPLQCSCLENPRDGRNWWAAIYGVAQSRTRQKGLSSSSSSIVSKHEQNAGLFAGLW